MHDHFKRKTLMSVFVGINLGLYLCAMSTTLIQELMKPSVFIDAKTEIYILYFISICIGLLTSSHTSNEIYSINKTTHLFDFCFGTIIMNMLFFATSTLIIVSVSKPLAIVGSALYYTFSATFVLSLAFLKGLLLNYNIPTDWLSNIITSVPNNGYAIYCSSMIITIYIFIIISYCYLIYNNTTKKIAYA